MTKSPTLEIVEFKLHRAVRLEPGCLDLSNDLLEQIPGAHIKRGLILIIKIEAEERDVVIPGLPPHGGGVHLAQNVFETVFGVGDRHVVVDFVVDVPAEDN